MSPTATGWTLFILALGMICTLLSGDVKQLHSWGDMFYPSFIGGMLAHVGAVVAAFLGGKAIPTYTNQMTTTVTKDVSVAPTPKG